MKTKITILLIALLPFIFFGCQKNEVPEDVKIDQTENGELKSLDDLCGEPLIGNLTDWEQTVNPGNLIIGNDEDNLYVTFEATGTWAFASLYLYVGSPENVPGEINNDGTGHFSPWNFPIGEWYFSGTQYETFIISLEELDECFIVVGYSNAENLTTGEEALVYGKSNFKSSGYYMDYCLQECAPPPSIGSETCFAYGDQYAYCFRDFKKKNGQYNPGGSAKKNYSRWGWTNEIAEGSYNFEVWAGAGQCDLTKGTLVGHLAIEYYSPTATVTYNMIPGYVLTETHLYIGDEAIPKKNNNKPTLAPGQYPYKHGNLGNATTDTYTVNGLSGDIWVIAHGVAEDAQ